MMSTSSRGKEFGNDFCADWTGGRSCTWRKYRRTEGWDGCCVAGAAAWHQLNKHAEWSSGGLTMEGCRWQYKLTSAAEGVLEWR